MEIQRPLYLNKIRARMHNGMIKVITGIRRSGKSYLLFRLFYRELLQRGVPADHILFLRMPGIQLAPSYASAPCFSFFQPESVLYSEQRWPSPTRISLKNTGSANIGDD